MEVHHHAHTARKKWTHYLWEFLMLFLAVTLGFLVENQREHYVEHQREKQFIRSLFNDIRSDTANIAKIISARTVKERMLDSLSFMMNSPRPSDLQNRYILMRWSSAKRFHTGLFQMTAQCNS